VIASIVHSHARFLSRRELPEKMLKPNSNPLCPAWFRILPTLSDSRLVPNQNGCNPIGDTRGRISLFRRKHNVDCATTSASLRATLLTASVLIAFLCSIGLIRPACARQIDSAKPVVVQPGAPGKPSKTLPPSTRATVPPLAQADVEFMQGMIMHHSQAIEMTSLLESHTTNKELRSLGARIRSSQSDEIKFMQRWLALRGKSLSMATPAMPGMHMAHDQMPLMPGMLTPDQMEVLQKANGADFDHLFLTGMIQHHNGALTMVKDLFDTAGAGQDAELFNFATDADNSQRAEIKIMEAMLEKKPLEEK
jgi:uncharacterized protein (DUF305 family)